MPVAEGVRAGARSVMSRPKVLAFDCSGAACSVAVAVADTGDVRLLSRRAQQMQRGHAAALAPMIDASLADAGLRPSDMDLLAVTVGPGSFTGVRIGLAMARGLALALRVPLAGLTTVGTLLAGVTAADREGAHEQGRRLLAAIDTHRGDYYAAFGDAPSPFVANADHIASVCAGEALLVIGDGAATLCPVLAGAGVDALPAAPVTPDAEALARLALQRRIDDWRAGNDRDGLPRPLYLRPAEVTLPRTTTLR